MTTTVHEIHGLLVSSPVPLPAPLSSGERADVTVRLGSAAPLAAAPPPGDVLASVGSLDASGYTLVRQGDRYVLRIGMLAEFRINVALSEIDILPSPETDPGIIPLLLAGNVLATLLTLRGEHVLHASAIALHGRALGFVGHSGAGKSTLAALFCAGPATLLADDALRVARDGSGVSCFGGGTQIRLRPGAVSLAEGIKSSRTATCADGRTGVVVPQPITSCPLHALVVPSRCDPAGSLRLTRLAPAAALFALLARCRIGGWRDPHVLRSRLEGLEQIIRTVPVYSAEIPWATPFSPGIAAAITDAVGLSRQFARV